MQFFKFAAAAAALMGGSLADAFSLADVYKVPVTSTTFNNIVYYAEYAAAAYSYKCPKPANAAQQIKFFSDNTTETQAYLFYIPSKNQVVISFRGTSTAQDWATDLEAVFVNLTLSGTNCAACRVHKGFQTAFASVQDDVLSSIKEQLAKHANSSLIVTGHSLGAALASYASIAIAANKIPIKAVYTYGEPLNGNLAWAAYANKVVSPSIYHRVTHAYDCVPRIPVPALGWAHHGTEYWQRLNHTASQLQTFNCGLNSTLCNQQYALTQNPNNPAHFFYGNDIIANSLHVKACGANPPYAR